MAASWQTTVARRRGVSTLESVLVLIVLLVATMASIQFGLALIVKQAISHAATVAAREAGKGAELEELVVAANQVLKNHQIAIGDHATLVLVRGGDQAQAIGRAPCKPPFDLTLQDDEAQVTIAVSLNAPVFINVLKPFGLDFTGRTFQVSAVSICE